MNTGKQSSDKEKRLFIGVPIYGGVDPHFFMSFAKLVQRLPEVGVSTSILPWVGDSLVNRARNSLTAEFLKTDCTHMLMIDSDLVFSVEQIVRLLSHDEAVVGGFYPKKKEGPVELVCNSFTDGQPAMDTRRLTSLKYIGTGFLLVAREVFERMIEVYGSELVYKDDSQGRVEHDFWTVGVYAYPDGTRRFLSEDWYFCQRCLDLGYQVWGDNGVMLRHSGSAVYPLSYQTSQLYQPLPEVGNKAGVDSIPVATPASVGKVGGA